MSKALCYRCEFRAQYLEEGYAPRSECKEVNMAVAGCYMYQPVHPIAFRPRQDDNRPVTLNALGARIERSEEQPEFVLCSGETKEGNHTVYWSPKAYVTE